jgi:hypothetical protein
VCVCVCVFVCLHERVCVYVHQACLCRDMISCVTYRASYRHLVFLEVVERVALEHEQALLPVLPRAALLVQVAPHPERIALRKGPCN